MSTKINGQKPNKHLATKLFLPFAIIFGLAMTFLTPPFQSPDEPAHFLRAYQVSDFTFIPDVEGNASGGYLPESLFETILIFDLNSPEHINKLTREMMRKALNVPLKKETKGILPFPNVAIYFPVLYIPQATGIFIGKLFNFPPIILLYLARIFNLGFWILLIYTAIKWIPFNKWLIAALSLTPMAIFLSGSANADTMVMGYTFLFFTYTLKVAFDRKTKLDRKTLLMLTFLSVLVALSKNIYVLLSLLVFVVPVSKASGIKDYILKLSVFYGATAIAAAVSYFFVQGILNKIEVIELYYGGEPFPLINPDKQVEFILSDIPGFLMMVYHSFGESPSVIIKSWIGILGWFELIFSDYYYLFALCVLMAFAALSDHKKISTGLLAKGLFSMVIMAILLAFSFTMYCSWSAPGDPLITNLQGRYFIPVAPLALFLFQNRKLQVPSLVFPVVFSAFAIVSMVLTVRMLLFRYYF